ncbi:MAG: signal peptide peptidase SppA [Eggerthellaceae bacterium]|nr:signal peptide peptidase SppA [Eggerthellaceae bacterium]
MPTNNEYWNHTQPVQGQQQYQQPQPQYAAPYQAPQQPQQPQKKSHGWIVAIVVIVCLFIFTGFCVSMCTSSINSLSSTTSSLDGLDGDAIAIIDIDGTIQYDGSACSPEGLKELLDEAEDNDNIKAVVLRVNSGGGTATAGEEMAEYVRQFAEVKPVVVSSASINASAAYEISSQADYIFVAKSTEIGAIGTAMQLTDISGLLDMLGVNMEVITSADEKDSSYGYRPLTDEERAEYQRMVDQINEVFIQNVADGRGMSIDEVKKLATGMPFTGIDAVENGLADKIGTREDAVEKAAELAGITDYTTTDLYFANYDLSGLTDLLGKSDTSVEDLVDLLKSEQNAKLR